jgi:hypothetical protein
LFYMTALSPGYFSHRLVKVKELVFYTSLVESMEQVSCLPLLRYIHSIDWKGEFI